MTKNGVMFGETREQVVAVGEADACSSQTAPTTVYSTLGIGAFGSNYFCGDLEEPTRTADFICSWLGYQGAVGLTTAPKPLGSACAYKTEASSPYFGLSGNWGHGTEVLSQVECATLPCGTPYYPTTVYATLGIGAYGSNCLSGDLGDPKRTADFVCTKNGFDRSIGYRAGPKTASNFCAYKTEASSPNAGLSGNWGHGIEQLTEVRCVN